MDKIKEKISEKVADTAINYTKDTVKEVIQEDIENGGKTTPKDDSKSSVIKQDKELKTATQEIFENTKNYIDENKDNIILVTKKFADIASKVIDKTKEKVIETYVESREDEINKMKIKEEGKNIIIDATTGEEKSKLNKELNYGAISFDKFLDKNYTLRNLKADAFNMKKNTSLGYLDIKKDKHIKKQ